jgi:hypothetical protein
VGSAAMGFSTLTEFLYVLSLMIVGLVAFVVVCGRV